MHLVTAIVKPHMLEAVKDALQSAAPEIAIWAATSSARARNGSVATNSTETPPRWRESGPKRACLRMGATLAGSSARLPRTM